MHSSGGSYSNMMAMILARTRKFHESKALGLCNMPQLVSFSSEQAHFCMKKNAMILGIGMDNCISVKCDKRGKMISEDLKKCVLGANKLVPSPNKQCNLLFISDLFIVIIWYYLLFISCNFFTYIIMYFVMRFFNCCLYTRLNCICLLVCMVRTHTVIDYRNACAALPSCKTVSFLYELIFTCLQLGTVAWF